MTNFNYQLAYNRLTGQLREAFKARKIYQHNKDPVQIQKFNSIMDQVEKKFVNPEPQTPVFSAEFLGR